MSDDLLEIFISNFDEDILKNKNFCVGLSGGIDSVVLLYLLKAVSTKFNINVSAVHVNHSISVNSNIWETFCRNLCSNLAISLEVVKVDIVRNGGESLENNARKIRYHTFINLNEDVIVLAHHNDDQLETLLSQIMRGSDIHNLASMRKIVIKNNKLIWRPFLEIPKILIEEYAKKHDIFYIVDESNLEQKYLRNFIRHSIVPTIKKYDLQIPNKLNQLIINFQNASHLLDEIAIDDIKSIALDLQLTQFDAQKFQKLSILRQSNLLNFLLKQHSLQLPTQRKIYEFCRQVVMCSWDRIPELQGYNYILFKKKHIIFLQVNADSVN